MRAQHNTFGDDQRNYPREFHSLSAPSSFPGLLQHIYKPPKQLYYAGDLPRYDNTFITIVGTRNPSPYALEVAQMILETLGPYREKISIVSGLAIGIDAFVHEQCLKHQIPAIAMPGSGLSYQVLYPRCHIGLATRILESGGCVLSEFEPDIVGNRWTFPARNRLMAGISGTTIVIEATEKSGTLITARYAMEENREVIAIPGPITNPRSMGGNDLIRNGAIPLVHPQDLPYLLGLEENTPIDDLSNNSHNPATKKMQPKLFHDLSDQEKTIVELLENPKTLGELSRQTSLPLSRISQIISALEMKGVIKNDMGNYNI